MEPWQPWVPPGGLAGGAAKGGRGVWPLLAIALTRSHFSAKNCNQGRPLIRLPAAGWGKQQCHLGTAKNPTPNGRPQRRGKDAPQGRMARSGTGLLAWAVLLAFWASHAWRTRGALKLAGLLLLAAMAMALPLLLGRPDLWQSLSGRLSYLTASMGSSTPWQWLFGQGLTITRPTDSLPTLLLLQGGLLSLVAFYGLLFWAWMHSPMVRPFLLVVALGSLTLPITELIPIDLLLGLCLHGALQLRVEACGHPAQTLN